MKRDNRVPPGWWWDESREQWRPESGQTPPPDGWWWNGGGWQPPPGPGGVLTMHDDGARLQGVTSVTSKPASYRPLSHLAAWVEALLGVSVVVSFLAALNQIQKTALDGRVLGDPLKVSVSDLEHADHRQVVLGRWALPCIVVTGVVFLVWLYRAASNARAAGTTSDSPGLAVGGLVHPLRESRAADRRHLPGVSGQHERTPAIAIVRLLTDGQERWPAPDQARSSQATLPS